MLRSWTFTSLGLLFVLACGPDKKVFDNPVDPDCEDISLCSSGTSGATDTTNTGATDTETGGTETGAGPTGGTSGGSTTTTVQGPTGYVYNFAKSFNVTPQGCTKVTGVKVFQEGTGLLVFVSANCGQRTNLYSFKASFAGVAETTPVEVTDCATGSTGLKYFDVDKGASGYMVGYLCMNGSNAYSTHVRPVDNTGAPGITQNIETAINEDYRIAWNPTASAYLLARAGQVQRLDESGNSIGGPLVINTIDVSSIKVFSGAWHIYHNYTYSHGYHSIVTDSGILRCGSTGDYYFRDALTETVSIRFSSSYSYTINRATVSNSTCAFSPPDVTTDLTMTNKTNESPTPFGAIALASNVGGLLYKTGNSLIFATTPITTLFKVNSESSITGFTTLTSAKISVINTKVYVSYNKNELGYVSYSNESIP